MKRKIIQTRKCSNGSPLFILDLISNSSIHVIISPSGSACPVSETCSLLYSPVLFFKLADLTGLALQKTRLALRVLVLYNYKLCNNIKKKA